MRFPPRGPSRLVAALGLLVSAAGAGAAGAEYDPARPPDLRDARPTIDRVDPVRVLSADKAGQLEAEIRAAYARLAPAVVRLRPRDDPGSAFSGVIVDRKGLVLTCSHHGLAPGSPATIELADGRRVPGKMLGRFRLDDPDPRLFGPDLGLAALGEGGDWPAAALDDGDGPPDDGRVCLAIGYPGTLGPGRPPLLRVGRIPPGAPGWPWLEPTTSGLAGDSGGPLFDLRGRVLGVLSGTDNLQKYQPVAPLGACRARLEAGEVVAAPRAGIRALRARPAQPAAFCPAPDVEDRVLQVQRSVFRVMDGPHEVAAGLIVDEDGWAITKASLVGRRDRWPCRLFYFRDGKVIVGGRVVATSPAHDLALLKLDVRDWPVPRWAGGRPGVGAFVASILGRTAGPLQFAAVGAEACPEPPRPGDVPQLPIDVAPDADGAPAVNGPGWSTAEFDAYRDLLEAGDVITHLGGIPTPTFADFARALDRSLYAPGAGGIDYAVPAPGSFAGDWVGVGIRRGEAGSTVRIPKVHSLRVRAMEWHSHPLSLRRESFPATFAHDFALRPEQCGGPVVDLSGAVAGLNIARADATRTLAIPADALREAIQVLRGQAEGAPARSPPGSAP